MTRTAAQSERAAHTPGPWAVERGAPGYWNITAKVGPLDVQPATAHGLDDARLIAAAPDMREALAVLIALVDTNPNAELADLMFAWRTAPDGERAARAALAKADTETEKNDG